MVMTNHSWEQETRKYLAEVQSELNKVEKELAVIQGNRAELAREAKAYETALQSYLKRTGKQDSIKSDWKLLSQQKNHQERLKRIAERSNGTIKVGSASNHLYNLRLIKSKTRANAYRIVYGLLSDMVDEGQFKKIGPSMFQLIDSKQSSLLPSEIMENNG